VTPKAKLTIVLKADDTVVAESEDMALWQRVLASITGNKSAELADDKPDMGNGAPRELEQDNGDDALVRFAKSLGVDKDVVTGALSPSREAPYLHLDHHCWAAMKKNAPQRGPGSINATGLAGTLLVLWFKEAKIDVPATQALAGAVLDTVNVKDPNPSRGIKNTKWLQSRGAGTIVINAAEIGKALVVAKSFCTKTWAKE
jgi:hypothetical protein